MRARLCVSRCDDAWTRVYQERRTLARPGVLYDESPRHQLTNFRGKHGIYEELSLPRNRDRPSAAELRAIAFGFNGNRQTPETFFALRKFFASGTNLKGRHSTTLGAKCVCKIFNGNRYGAIIGACSLTEGLFLI